MTDKQNYFTYIDNTSDDTNKTYKQTIIDGVDVSGCINYEEYFEEDEDVKIENFCAYWHNSCHSCHNYNCNYKMYKRAEQKLEKIKEICKNVMPTGIDEETDKFGDILDIIEE